LASGALAKAPASRRGLSGEIPNVSLNKKTDYSRRSFLKLAGAAAAGPLFAFKGRLGLGSKSLRIAKWAHFVPEFDPWFVGMAKEWGEQHDTEVTVDLIPPEQIRERAQAEVEARKGHDLVIFPWPPAEFARHVIDHAPIYQALRLRHGVIDALAHRSTYHVPSRRYFAFCDSWLPAPFHYYTDEWAEAGMPMGPLNYGSLRSGGKRIKEKVGMSCGLALTPTLEGNITLNTLLVAFGGAVMDVHGTVLLERGARTIEALKYARLLAEETGPPDALLWGPSDNVRMMLERKTTCSINAISLMRSAEARAPEAAEQMRLSPPLLGPGVGVVGVPHVTNCSAVWDFSTNKEGATSFLADLPDVSKTAYERSRGCNFPIFQKTLPDLIVRLESDERANPPGKYKELKDALHWTHNLGVPGYATPAFMETFNRFVIPRMFLSVVRGESTPEGAVHAAQLEVQDIVNRWNNAPA
jgi:multiple sugar transport system substrate-binding protein